MSYLLVILLIFPKLNKKPVFLNKKNFTCTITRYPRDEIGRYEGFGGKFFRFNATIYSAQKTKTKNETCVAVLIPFEELRKSDLEYQIRRKSKKYGSRPKDWKVALTRLKKIREMFIIGQKKPGKVLVGIKKVGKNLNRKENLAFCKNLVSYICSWNQNFSFDFNLTLHKNPNNRKKQRMRIQKIGQVTMG